MTRHSFLVMAEALDELNSHIVGLMPVIESLDKASSQPDRRQIRRSRERAR